MSAPTTPGRPAATAGPTPTPRATGARHAVSPLGLGGSLVVVAALVAVLLSPRQATRLADPGTLVRWGLPVAEALHDLALAVALGALALVCLVLPVASPAAVRGRQVATAAAVAWTVAALGVLVLTYASVSGTAPTDPAFGDELGGFVSGFEVGQALLATVLLAAAAATVATGATGPRSSGLALLLVLAGILPVALLGHSGSAEGHETAVTAMGLHLLGTGVWVGGLLALVAVRPLLDDDTLAVTVRRYSGLALAAVLLVVVSGVANATTRLATVTDLASRYGVLLLAKSALVVVLVAIGYAHRRALLPRLHAGAPGAFWRLVVVELLVMATTIGVAVALAGTAPPVSDSEAPPQWSAGEVLVGYEAPPEQTVGRLLTEWRPDLLWVLVVAVLGAGYLLGVHRLRRRGDAWPPWRTVLWLAGLAVVLLVTSSGLSTYGRWLFSTHMLQHMTMSMVAPLLLVPAAPVTLALRALQRRGDGSRGPREWLLWGLHTPWARFLTHPVVAAAVFAGSLVVFYHSELFGLALRTHYGHEAMHVHFLLTGYLFVWSLVGTDPGVRPTPYPLRLLILFATIAFHAFFAIALMDATQVLQPGYWETVAADRGWGRDPLADQRHGAALAWGIGEVPTILIAGLVALRWVQDDDREARRRDRKARRDGDADLQAYNDMLARLSEADRR